MDPLLFFTLLMFSPLLAWVAAVSILFALMIYVRVFAALVRA